MRLTTILLVAALLPAALSAQEMRKGKWQISMRTEGPNPSQTQMTQCMDDIQAATMAGMPPAAQPDDYSYTGEADGCEQSMTKKGNVMTMESICAEESMQSTMTMGTDSYSMRSVTKTKDTTETTIVEGKRLGDC